MNVPYVAQKMGEFVKEGKDSPEIASLCDEVRARTGNFLSNLFYTIAYSITHTKEPEGNDVWQTPKETLKGRGDCEDLSIVLASAAAHEKIPCMVKFTAVDADYINHVYPVLYDEVSDEWFACDASPNHNAKLGFEAPYTFAELYRVDGGIWPVGKEISISDPGLLAIILVVTTLLLVVWLLRFAVRG